MNNSLKGNLAMGASKTFSGLNENALRYLLPHWMAPFSGVAMRLGFGAIAFWVMGWIRGWRDKRKKAHSPHTAVVAGVGATPISVRQKISLFMLGAVLMMGYMTFLLLGLSYTTPIASSIFISTEPVWVFLLCVMLFGEKVTRMKVIGIVFGLGGALLCIFTQKQSEIATNPMLGNIYCAISAIVYSLYLVASDRLLRHIDNITVTKWSFLGGTVSAIIAVSIVGWDAPVIQQGLFSTPMLVLAFVLIFPTAIGYYLTNTGLKYLSATVVALYGYVILIVATVVSYILGQDRFDWFQILAMLMIVLSVYFVEVAERRTSPSAASTKRVD